MLLIGQEQGCLAWKKPCSDIFKKLTSGDPPELELAPEIWPLKQKSKVLVVVVVFCMD